MIENSFDRPTAQLSREKADAMNRLRAYMFEKVYHNRQVKKAEDIEKIRNVIVSLYRYFMERPDALPEDLRAMEGEFSHQELVKDHIAGMTDRYALGLYEELFL